MKNNRLTLTASAIALALAISSNLAFAGGDHGSHGKPAVNPAATVSTAAPTVAGPSTAKEMTEAEVRKVDVDNLKITLKHGFIKNLDMPGMTMVFTTKDKALLEGLATGDKVQFAVEMIGGKFTVTELKKSAP